MLLFRRMECARLELKILGKITAVDSYRVNQESPIIDNPNKSTDNYVKQIKYPEAVGSFYSK